MTKKLSSPSADALARAVSRRRDTAPMMKFFKANEKVIMVVLLAIIAPSFAFTGLMYTALQQSGSDVPVFDLHNDTVKASEYEVMRGHRLQMQKVELVLNGYFPLRVGAGLPDIVEDELLRRKARKEGIAATPDEIGQVVTQVGKFLIAGYQLVQQNGRLPDFQTYQREIQKRMAEVRFVPSEYRKALLDPNLAVRMTVSDFERYVGEILTKQKVLNVFARSVPMSEREIYEEYELQNQLRVLDVVRLSRDGFIADAVVKAQEDDDRLRQFYFENPFEFRVADQVRLEIAQVSDRNSYEPTEEELQASYEQDKERLYRRPVTVTPEEGAEPAPVEYLSFEEVRERVVGQARLAKETSAMEKALVDARRRQAAGEEFALFDLFADYAPSIEVYTTSLFSNATMKELPSSYRNDAKLGSIFTSFGAIEEGQFGKEVVPLSAGKYIYRVIEKVAAHQPSFVDCREQVAEKLAEEIATELAEEELAGWSQRIADSEEVTFQSLADAANLKIHRTEPVSRGDTQKVKVDDKPLAGAGELLLMGSLIDDIGDFGEVARAPDGSEVYLMRLVETQKPDSGRYQQQRASLRQQLLNEKIQVAETEFLSVLQKEANYATYQSVDAPEDGS